MTTVDPHIIYNRYSDNLARTATITLDGCTAESGYDIANVADHNAAWPLRLVETSGAIIFDLGTSLEVRLPALFHCNFEEGLAVSLKAKDTNSSWGSPSFQYDFDIPAWRADGFPGQPWDDLSGLTNWGAYRYWRLEMATNSVALTLGDVWLGATVRRLDPDYRPGRRRKFDRPQVEHKTAYTRLRSSLGTTFRSVTGQIPPTNDALAQDVLDWMLDADGRPFLFVPDATENEAWLAIHAITAQEFEDQLDHDAQSIELPIEEAGRGLAPTPSPV